MCIDLVLEIETMTRHFIDTSFRKLRSAEGAFDLLQNFQTIQSRDSINRQMMEKYNDTLLQYSKELETIQATFESGKAAPPIFKNYPPVAGAIAWANALYLRTKEPILKFKNMSNLLKGKQGEQVKEAYLTFARSKEAFVKGHFNRWKDRVPYIVTEQLKQPILAMKNRDNTFHLVTAADKKMGQYGTSGKQRATGQLSQEQTAPANQDSRNDDNYMEEYVTNFSPALLMVMRESKYLDRMGFEVPEAALNVTLQEDKFHHYVQELETMLGRYTKLLHGLTPVESQLLKKQLKTLKGVLGAGFSPLNWNSQRIPSFIERCSHELTTFQGVVNQINKSSVMINDVVEAIDKTFLVSSSDFPLSGTLAIEVSEFYEIMERNRPIRIEALVRKYKEVSVTFMKVEELVAGTGTGKSPDLAIYYSYWERRFFNAITTMIVSSMGMVQALLNIGFISGSDRTSAKPRPPLCKVKCSLNGKDIVVSPPLTDIYKYLNRCMKHIVESAKAFVRWKRGTCIMAEPQMIHGEDEEMVVFSFYSDVSKNPIVIKVSGWGKKEGRKTENTPEFLSVYVFWFCTLCSFLLLNGFLFIFVLGWKQHQKRPFYCVGLAKGMLSLTQEIHRVLDLVLCCLVMCCGVLRCCPTLYPPCCNPRLHPNPNTTSPHPPPTPPPPGWQIPGLVATLRNTLRAVEHQAARTN
jgi:dynein heavy chain